MLTLCTASPDPATERAVISKVEATDQRRAILLRGPKYSQEPGPAIGATALAKRDKAGQSIVTA